jgi:hypothetical protein
MGVNHGLGIPNISQLQAKEIRHLRRIDGKTKRERIRDQTIRMEL